MALYFEETGNRKASTIVFLHGGGISGWMWRKQLEYFKDYHCIIPDLPEHGKSVDAGPLSISDCAKRIADLIEDEANRKKAHVIGHSLGGKVLVELLSIRPEVVDRAVVASALFRPVSLMKLIHKPFIYKLTIWLLKYRSLLSWTVKAFEFPDKIYTENCINEFQKLTAERIYKIYDQLYQYLKLPEGLAKISVPTLVVAGEKELKAMRQSVIDLVNIIPNSKGILMRGGKHTYPWAKYKCFNEVIRLWLNNEMIPNDLVRAI